MKITIAKGELLSKLILAGRIIQANKTNPEYDNFLFEYKEGKMYVTGADESGWIITEVDCMVDPEDGKETIFTAEAKLLLDALKEIPEQPLVLNISFEKKYVNITAAYMNGKFELVGGKGELFPMVNPLSSKDDTEMSVSSHELLYGLKRTNFSCANDQLRPVMNGVYIDQTADRLTFVSSDGHCLSMVEYFKQCTDRCSFILPSKIAKILTAVTPVEETEVNVIVSSKHATFQFPLFVVHYRMIEGRYPNYRAVIPVNNDKFCKVNRTELSNVIKRVSVFCNHVMALRLSLSADKLLIAAQNIDYSISANEELPVEYSASNLEIGLNATRLLELLSNTPSPEIVMSFSEHNRAILVKAVEAPAGSEDHTLLIMPMLTN